MRPTRLARLRPFLTTGGLGYSVTSAVSSNSLALGGVIPQNSATSNTHLVAVSSNAAFWVTHSDSSIGSNFETRDGGGHPVSLDHGDLGSTETINAADANHHRGTLDQNCTITVAAFDDGSIVLVLYQNGTGGWTVTWSGVDFGGADDQPDTTASSATVFTFLSDDGNIYGFKAGAAAEAAGGSSRGAILLESGHSVPFTFDEILQESDGSDFLYASE